MGFPAGDMNHQEIADYLIEALLKLCWHNRNFTIYIVIDGLNVLPDEDIRLVINTLDRIMLEINNSQGRAKIFISSQPGPFINTHFKEKGYVEIPPQRITDMYMQIYLHNQASTLTAELQ